MKKVFVYGSVNIDLVSNVSRTPLLGETIYGNEFFINVGGKGANQAAAVSKFGQETYFIGSVGNDNYKEYIIDQLNTVNLKLDYLNYSNQNSGIAQIVVSENDNQIIIHPNANYDNILNNVRDVIENKTNEGDIFLVQLELRQEDTFEAIKMAKSKGLYVVMNPAPFSNFEFPFENYVDLFVFNEIEADCAIGKHEGLSLLEKFIVLKNKGYKDSIITLGNKGSCTYINNQLIEVNSHDVKIIDTTGAGDTYIGSLVYWLAQNKGLRDAMEFSSAAAALSVTKKGALKSIPTLKEVYQFLEESNENIFK